MAIGKPTPDWPSTNVDLTMLVNPGAMPRVTATASILQGAESVFVLVEVDDMPKDRPRHAARFVLIGDRASMVAVLRQLRLAVDAAQPVTPEQ
jgi:hypothetical protein